MEATRSAFEPDDRKLAMLGVASPLKHIKVVEIGVAMAGPFCGMMLGDYGAEVIKVERVQHGDDSRGWTPYFHDSMSHYFASANRNKKSLAIDLKSPEGVEIVKRLIESADVVIDNYRLGALARAGLVYESLSKTNPRLIYCSISGFGATGPRGGEPANDLLMQAFSGGMSITGEVGGGPVKMGISVADIGAGMLGTIGILMALESRHHTGRGQRVDTSLLEGQMSMMSYHLAKYFASGAIPGPSGSGGGVGVPYQAFQTADDWLVVATFNERMWRDFCVAIDKPKWSNDPRFMTADDRSENRDVLIGMINEVFATRSASEWARRLAAASVPCTLVNSVDQIVTEQQVLSRQMVVEMNVPNLGPIKLAGLPLKFSETPGELRLHPPRLGEHSQEILLHLGYDMFRINSLARDGVIGLWSADACTST